MREPHRRERVPLRRVRLRTRTRRGSLPEAAVARDFILRSVCSVRSRSVRHGLRSFRTLQFRSTALVNRRRRSGPSPSSCSRAREAQRSPAAGQDWSGPVRTGQDRGGSSAMPYSAIVQPSIAGHAVSRVEDRPTCGQHGRSLLTLRIQPTGLLVDSTSLAVSHMSRVGRSGKVWPSCCRTRA